MRLADGAAALHTDRGHSLGSLHLPLAALPSLPIKGGFLTITRRLFERRVFIYSPGKRLCIAPVCEQKEFALP